MLEFIGSIIEIFGSIALDIQEFLFRRKREKRRAYEKANNLPPRKMRSPYERVGILLGVFMGVIIVLKIISFFSGNSLNESVTKNKVVEIKALLEKEKEVFGKYPEKLNIIKRNNPLRNDLLVDAWGTTFTY
ncbi:hypothetical protein ACSIGC_11100 [Tenacibaculum sp. ZS6-P6]|uniref:hypothetical protein n=1 Tax=Tenacibaculum sp. ZS6-P6 TaxID=3447503 RepID=UPI003F952F3F